MKTKVKSRNGISLIVLVITIIVMIVLAGAIILALNNSGVIGKASMGRAKSDLSTLMEEVQVKVAERKLNGLDIDGRYKLSDWGIENSTYENRVIIDKGNLRVLNLGEDDEIKKAAIELGIITNTANAILENTTGEKLVDYKIYGNSVQNGTPSPDKPVEIESLGDLVTETGDLNYGKYKIPIKMSGKNLIDYKNFKSRNQSLYPLTINEDGSINYEGDYYIKVDISFLESGKTYTFNMKYTMDGVEPSEKQGTYQIYYDDGTYDSSYYGSSIATNPDKKITKLHCYFKSGYTETFSAKLWDIQLEEATRATSYETYQSPILTYIYLNEPLRKVANYADYVDFGNNKIVRQVGIKNTDFVFWNYKDNYLYLTNKGIFDDKSEESVVGMSDKFFYFDKFPGSSRYDRLLVAKGKYYFVWACEESEKEQYINLLKDTKIQYLLKVPTEENISLPDVSTLKGTTIISVIGENGVGASNILVEY